MSKIPVFRINAVLRQELPSNTPVWNSDEIEYYLWIRVPRHLGHEFSLYNVCEITDEGQGEDLIRKFYWEPCHPWYRVKTGHLNKTPGFHKYRMSFVSRKSGDTISLYFAYVFQCNHPDKPYKYIDHSGECEC